MSLEPLPLEAAEVLGRYELLSPVARGGMGQVWLGRLRGARGFNKLVAIKTLLPLDDEEGRLERMLLEEARIAALIHHPNVVQTIELGEHEKSLYLVMEWVEGESLGFLSSQAWERGGLPLNVAVNLAAQTLLGLHAAHELRDDSGALLGVVHRDVSPQNVLVTYTGVAKLLDFGVAKAVNQENSTTQQGEVKGKFSYMSPEQIRGESVDRRADIFAMGILLYLLTAGDHPFKGPNSASVIHRIVSDDPPEPPSRLRRGYPPALESVVMKALAKDQADRFASADDMRQALQRAVPDAFLPGIETERVAAIAQLTGDRIAERREARQRALLEADVRALAVAEARARQPGAKEPTLAAPSQSATSLKALSIDNPPFELDSGSEARPPSRPQPWKGRIALGVATAALTVAAVVGALRVSKDEALRSPASPSSGLESFGVPHTNLAVPPPANDPPTSPSAPSAPTEAVASPPVPTTSASAIPPELGAQSPAASKRPTSAPTRAAQVQRKSKDLLAPDYAR